MYYIIKVLITAILVVVISELSKRSSFWGGIFASIPLISVLAFIWLYIDIGSTEKISRLSFSIFWLVIPSLSLFIILPELLKYKWNFYLTLFISIMIMIICYYVMIFILNKAGIKI
ncbi:MAG TPA: DUF3147 family protein [Ignavibacteriaceae bacterium]|nr:DUF3147 family protein [Ignavibacteriaceae bacterium]